MGHLTFFKKKQGEVVKSADNIKAEVIMIQADFLFFFEKANSSLVMTISVYQKSEVLMTTSVYQKSEVVMTHDVFGVSEK